MRSPGRRGRTGRPGISRSRVAEGLREPDPGIGPQPLDDGFDPRLRGKRHRVDAQRRGASDDGAAGGEQQLPELRLRRGFREGDLA